jgi:hypothetical protein
MGQRLPGENGGLASPFDFAGDDMDFYRAAQENGWTALTGEQVTVAASSGRLFPNPHANTKMVVFAVRGAGITVRSDKGAATAGAAGIDYTQGGPYALPMNATELANVNAIQNGGAASIYAEYWGLP